MERADGNIGSFSFYINTITMLERFRIYILFFFIALGITFFVAKEEYIPNTDVKLKRHTEVLNHTAENIYKYRIFPTVCIEQIKHLTSLFTDNEKESFIIAVCVFGFISYWLTLLSMYLFFQNTGLEELTAIISVLLWVIILPFSITGWDEIGDILNVFFFSIAFSAMLQGSISVVVLTIIIASFNKEQAVLIPIFYCVGFFEKKFEIVRHFVKTAILLSVFFVSTFILHLAVGWGQNGTIESSYFGTDYHYNLQNPEWIIVWVLSLGIFVLYAIPRWKDQHPFLKNNALITLPLFYIVVFFIRARMREIDKAFILHLILIPMAVNTLFSKLNKNAT